VPDAEVPTPEATPAGSPPPPPRQSVIDATVDLLETGRDWVRQEAEYTVREKVARPLQDVGIAIGAVFAAGALIVIGLIFVAVALFMFLGQLIGYPGAFLAVGLAYIIGGLVFIVISQRKKLKDVAAGTDPTD
jgi:hypothetical protein